jgi:hypothetical protein
MGALSAEESDADQVGQRQEREAVRGVEGGHRHDELTASERSFGPTKG